MKLGNTGYKRSFPLFTVDGSSDAVYMEGRSRQDLLDTGFDFLRSCPILENGDDFGVISPTGAHPRE